MVVLLSNHRRNRLLSVKLSQEEWCQLDSLLVNLKVPIFDPDKHRNYTDSERFRMLIEVLAPKVENWHWLKWSRLFLDDYGSLKPTRRYPYSSDEDLSLQL